MVKKQDDFKNKDSLKKQENLVKTKDISKETVISKQSNHSNQKISFKGSITDKVKPTIKKIGGSVTKGAGKTVSGVAKGTSQYIEKVSEQADETGVKLVSQGMKASKQASQIMKKNKYRLLKKDITKLKKGQAPPTPLKKNIKQVPKNTFKKGKVLASKTTKEIAKQSYKNTEKVLSNADEEGVKLASQGMKALRVAEGKIKKNSSKATKKSMKLEKKDLLAQKEFNKSKLGADVKKENLNTLKKKNQKKKIYQTKRNDKTKKVSSISQRISKFFKGAADKLGLGNLKNLIQSKIALWFGGSLLFLLPIAFAGIIATTMIFSFGLGNSVEYTETQGGGKSLSADVEKWRSLVEKEANSQGMSDYVQLVLAIIQVETGGRGTKDIMQSSESAGHGMNYFKSEEESVRQGIKHLKGIVQHLQGYGKGYEKNFKLLAQAYNFGTAFASYVGKRGGEYNLEVAEDYSRTVVAPSLGNSIGLTYPYLNEVSKKLGKTYLYWNGGNFMYGEMVAQYVGGGGKDPSGMLQPVLGQPLNNGECYGLIAYYVEKLGGPQLMGSGKSYAMLIGEDYDWAKYGWTVTMYPNYSDLRAGDVINFTAGGNLAPGIWGHTGVIKEVLSDGNFTTFEQNAGKGRVCAEYTRNVNMNQIRSIVRPPQ